MLGKCFHPAST